jgi:hypothetical protein
MSDARVLVFGGCNLRGPVVRAFRPELREPEGDWDDVPESLAVSGAPFMTYTLSEMLQAIWCYQGLRRIPSDLYPLCNMKAEAAPSPFKNRLTKTDVILIEPNTSIEIEYEGYYLHRAAVLRVLTSLIKASPAARKPCSHWYRKGIVGIDPEARRHFAEQLVPLIPSDSPDRDLHASLLRNANGSKVDVRSAMETFVNAVGLPVGVVLYTWAYMPDGRGISWPAEFGRAVKRSASELNLPIFDPRPLVEQAGVAAALRKDLRHYSNTFMPVVAKAIVEFGLSIAESARNATELSAPDEGVAPSVAA